jgi:hypothetical protein
MIILNTPEQKVTAFKEAMAVTSEPLRAQHCWLFSHHIKHSPPARYGNQLRWELQSKSRASVKAFQGL